MKTRKLTRIKLSRILGDRKDEPPRHFGDYNANWTLDNPVVKGALECVNDNGKYDFVRKTPENPFSPETREIGYILGATYEGKKDGQTDVCIYWEEFNALGRPKRIVFL